MPIAEVSASVAAKYDNDFYCDAQSPQGRTLRDDINYSQECSPDGKLTERALAYMREVRFCPNAHKSGFSLLSFEHGYAGHQA